MKLTVGLSAPFPRPTAFFPFLRAAATLDAAVVAAGAGRFFPALGFAAAFVAFALGGCGSLAGSAVDGASSAVRGGANPGRRSALGFPPQEAAAALDFASGGARRAERGRRGLGVAGAGLHRRNRQAAARRSRGRAGGGHALRDKRDGYLGVWPVGGFCTTSPSGENWITGETTFLCTYTI